MYRFVLLAAVVLLSPVAPVWSATLTVRPDGTGDYPTIQDAINAASDGDSIVLAPGRFTGPGNRDLDTMGKAVVITSRHGPDATEIDAEYQSRVFHIHQGETNTTVISNLRISHGSMVDGSGAGMRCEGGYVCLTDVVFERHVDLGLAVVGGRVDMTRCLFVDDPVPGYQWPRRSGATFDTSQIRSIDCTFSWLHGFAIRASGSDLVITGSIVEHCGQFDLNDIVFFEDCVVSILGNVFRFNGGSSRTGVTFQQCTGEARSNWLEHNGANSVGGGLHWEDSAGDVSFNLLRENDDYGIKFTRSNGSILRNLIVRTGGGCCTTGTAIWAYGCQPIPIENNTFYRNGTDEYGPAQPAEMYLDLPSAQVTRNVIVGKSDCPWVVCDFSPGGCPAALIADSVYVDDARNLVFGEGQGLYETLATPCFEYPEYLDPLFRSEANDNFFLRPASFAMIDTIVGSYHIKRSWGALPKGSRPSDVLDVQRPPDQAPAGVQPGDRFPLAGFSITNASPMDAVVNYRLFVSGGALNDNGDPLSLVGTTPVLAAGENFVPPPAAVVVPAGDATVEVMYAFAYAPALNIVDTVRTTMHFGAPVSVRVTSFAAWQEESGVGLRWETAAGTAEIGWLLYRAADDGNYRRVTLSPLPPHTRTFLDTFARPGARYRYRLVALDPNEIIAAEIEITPTARLALEQNAPNPFNPETTIRFSLPAPAHAVLAVYGVDGAHIRTLVDRALAGGVYRETWDGRDVRGKAVPSGIYFCRLTADGRTMTRKMVLAK